MFGFEREGDVSTPQKKKNQKSPSRGPAQFSKIRERL